MDTMKLLSAVDRFPSQFHFYARFLDAPPGEYAEYRLGTVDTQEDRSGIIRTVVTGRSGPGWRKFVAEASRRKEVLQFGLERYPDVRLLCTARLGGFLFAASECIQFDLHHETPWEPVEGE